MIDGIKDKIRSVIYIEQSGTRKKKLNKHLLILLLVGVSLLLFSSFFSSEPKKAPPPDESSSKVTALPDIEKKGEDLEQEIADILDQIEGVSKTSVFLTVDTGPELILADAGEGSVRKTVEEDGGGGLREIEEETWKDDYVIMRDAQGGEVPLILYERRERYRGVLVVATGADDPWLQTRIVEALSSLLDLPSHRITILPRGN